MLKKSEQEKPNEKSQAFNNSNILIHREADNNASEILNHEDVEVVEEHHVSDKSQESKNVNVLKHEEESMEMVNTIQNEILDHDFVTFEFEEESDPLNCDIEQEETDDATDPLASFSCDDCQQEFAGKTDFIIHFNLYHNKLGPLMP